MNTYLEDGEVAVELSDGTFLISQGEHLWIDDECQCGLNRVHEDATYRYWMK